MSTQRVVVVGAGIVGLCSAYYLARAGRTVVVLDRDPIGAGASGGNAGLISLGHPPLNAPGTTARGLRWMLDRTSPLYLKPSLDPRLLAWLWNFHLNCSEDRFEFALGILCDLSWRTRTLLEELVATEAIDGDYGRDGWMDVVRDPLVLDEAEAEAQHLASYGFAYRRLDGDALRAREPAFRNDVAGAIWYPDSGHCHPADLLRGIADACRRAGVQIRTGVEVESLRQGKEGRVVGATLKDGTTVEADTVVLAAGIWSDELARRVGARIPMQPARGYHVQLDGLPALPSTGCVLHETYVAATPMRGQLRLAGTLEIAPVGRPWMHQRMAALRSGAARYLRGIEDARVVSEWAGYRPCTNDGLPAIGAPQATPGLVVATGHAMLGMTFGPITGKLVAELIDGDPSYDLTPLSPDRF